VQHVTRVAIGDGKKFNGVTRFRQQCRSSPELNFAVVGVRADADESHLIRYETW